MNRTTLAAALVSFALGIAAGWLLFHDPAPTVPQSKFADLEAAAAAIADENVSLREEVELRKKLNAAQFEQIETLKARIELMPEAL